MASPSIQLRSRVRLISRRLSPALTKLTIESSTKSTAPNSDLCLDPQTFFLQSPPLHLFDNDDRCASPFGDYSGLRSKTDVHSLRRSLSPMPLRIGKLSYTNNTPFKITTSPCTPLAESRFRFSSQDSAALIQSPCRMEQFNFQRSFLYSDPKKKRSDYSKANQSKDSDSLFKLATRNSNESNVIKKNKMHFQSKINASSIDINNDKAVVRTSNVGMRRINSVAECSRQDDSFKGKEDNLKLGQGGFGFVYLGYFNNNRCAIKRLKNVKTAAKATLCAELNAFMLHHPNIIVYEYVGSRNLQSFLDKAQTKLDWLCIFECLMQIATAIRYCHEQEILHLDLKPANILLEDGPRIVCDFGCSQKLSFGGTDLNFVPFFGISTGGTLIYRAPELLRGKKASKLCDVFSYGIILWQILTRTVPYQGKEMHSVVYQVCAMDLRPDFDTKLIECFNKKEEMLLKLGQQCWSQTPIDRPCFKNICSTLNMIHLTKF